MSFENLAKVTGFSSDKIKEHILALNSLVNRNSCSKDEQSALMFLLGAFVLTESYLGLEAKEKPQNYDAPDGWRQDSTGRWFPL